MEKRLSEGQPATQDRRLVGYVVRFNSPARIRETRGAYTEIVRPGAFAKAIAGSADIVALADHDRTRPLARRSNGTLRLVEDEIGLRFEADLNLETQLGRDLLAMAERRDLAGMSFEFVPRDEKWNADRTQRELRAVDLIEVSVITGGRPAYSGTIVQARDDRGHSAEHVDRRIRLIGARDA